MKIEKLSEILINIALFIFAATAVSTFCVAVWQGFVWLIGIVFGK